MKSFPVSPTVNIIAAMDLRNGIGVNGSLPPWRLKSDMAHFKSHTEGGSVLMGRGTWESLPEKFRPLPGRVNVVLTKHQRAEIIASCPADKHVFVCDSDFDALMGLGWLRAPKVWVIGGGAVYANMLDRADNLILTHVNGDFNCDVVFPQVDARKWRLVSALTEPRSEKDSHDVMFYHYKREVDAAAHGVRMRYVQGFLSDLEKMGFEPKPDWSLYDSLEAALALTEAESKWGLCDTYANRFLLVQLMLNDGMKWRNVLFPTPP